MVRISTGQNDPKRLDIGSHIAYQVVSSAVSPWVIQLKKPEMQMVNEEVRNVRTVSLTSSPRLR